MTRAPEGTEGERSYRGLSADERRAARRDALLAAALELFGTRGYGASSIEAVCGEAGLSQRHFYEQFASKEALLRAAHERVVAEVMGNVGEALEREKGLERRVRAGLSAFARTLADDLRKARVQLIECVGVSDDFERYRRDVRHAFADLLAREAERAATAGEIPRRDFRFGTMALVGAVTEMLVDWTLADDRPPIDAVVEECVRVFMATATYAG